MTNEEELWWRNQPEWKVNQEMERRIAEYLRKQEEKIRLRAIISPALTETRKLKVKVARVRNRDAA